MLAGADRPRVLGRRLAMSAKRGRARPGLRGVGQDRPGIPRPLRVVREACGVAITLRWIGQRGHGRGVERRFPVQGQRCLHRHARQLVPEGDSIRLRGEDA